MLKEYYNESHKINLCKKRSVFGENMRIYMSFATCKSCKNLSLFS